MYICRHCGDRRLPPPHDWAGERDRFPGASEPHPGGLGPCGDLHDWVPATDATPRRDTMRVWILGAPDPEMQLIEGLLAEAGEQVAHALDGTGQRVHPGSAYRAVALSAPLPDGATVYAVECGGPAVPAGAVVIDHHRPGDPGYGRPPAEFLSASSIGQVIAELARLGRLPQWHSARTVPGDGAGAFVLHAWAPSPAWWDDELGEWRGGDTPPPSWTVSVQSDYRIIPQRYAFAAAADHCLAAAYRGECPGVDPDALMRWRVAVRAAHQGRPVAELLEDVEQARARLRAAPVVALGERLAARDLRGEHVPELPEAAAREGLAYLATVTDRDVRQKIVLGAADAETVQAFLEQWAPRAGLVDLYGDPARGFAGGYVAGR